MVSFVAVVTPLLMLPLLMLTSVAAEADSLVVEVRIDGMEEVAGSGRFGILAYSYSQFISFSFLCIPLLW